ncbi:MAG: hypothetical protein J6N21_01215 [Butyrivibrio sp.]|nr:hypothetical protein [Butyrivibrio sp.]
MIIANGMDFVNNERVVGKWGFVGYIEDFIPKPAYCVFRKEEGALL